MPQFLIKKEEISEFNVTLKDNDNFFHIVKVLRARIGANIKFIDEDGYVYYCAISKITKNSLTAEILAKYESQRVLKNNIYLIQSILMTDSQNLAIANAAQTGVKGIYPVVSDNVSASKLSLEKKQEKWQKIADENFKQCERKEPAIVFEIEQLKDVLSKFKKENVLIFAERKENSTLNDCLNDIDKTSDIAIVVGPEGGFSNREFDYFIENNYKLITLGKMIYKAPNAIVAGVSNIVSRLEN